MSKRVDYKKIIKQIPHRVQLGAKIFYEVLWVESFPDPKVMGETRFNPTQIVIKKGMKPKETVITFFHELAHAYSSECDMNLTESQILKFEKKLYYLLKDNNILQNGNNNE